VPTRQVPVRTTPRRSDPDDERFDFMSIEHQRWDSECFRQPVPAAGFPLDRNAGKREFIDIAINRALRDLESVRQAPRRDVPTAA